MKTIEIPENGFLKPQWLKNRYGISNSTMYQWIAKGYLPAPIRIGPRAVRFKAEQIREFEAKFVAPLTRCHGS